MKLARPLHACCVAIAAPLAAQTAVITPTLPDPGTPRWVGHTRVLGANVAIGGLTGGVLQKLRGGSFRDGFLRGALGGTVTYAAKRIVVQNFWGAGLLGREVDAVGVSMVHNAAEGRPTFGRLFLPLGPVPVRMVLGLEKGARLWPQIDLSGAVWMAYGLSRPGLTLNAGRSLSSGTAVFQADGRWLWDSERDVRGYAAGRAVFMGDPSLYPAGPTQDEVLAHERVHVLQQDFVLTAWSDPFAGLVVDRFGPGRAAHRYVAVDALDWVVGALSLWTLGADRMERFPPELEARFLTGR